MARGGVEWEISALERTYLVPLTKGTAYDQKNGPRQTRTRAYELTPSPKSLFEAAQAKANQTQCAPDKRECGRLRCAVYYKRFGTDRSARCSLRRL